MAKKTNRKSAKGFANGIKEDLLDLIDIQYNELMKETITDLTFEKIGGKPVSPVLTGFFASSWKVSTKEIRQYDPKRKFKPSSEIKRQGNRLAPGYRPYLEIRHYIPKVSSKSPVYIGNTVTYAAQAIASPKNQIIEYILGPQGLDEKIDRIFRDNRPSMLMTVDSPTYQRI